MNAASVKKEESVQQVVQSAKIPIKTEPIKSNFLDDDDDDDLDFKPKQKT